MSLSKNPNAYLHVKPVLDAAVEHGGGKYILPDNKQAMRWRLQAYSWRKIISQSGPTMYDGLVLRVDGCVVTISDQVIGGEFVKADGQTVPLNQVMPQPEDALLDAALDFAKGLGDLEISDD